MTKQELANLERVVLQARDLYETVSEVDFLIRDNTRLVNVTFDGMVRNPRQDFADEILMSDIQQALKNYRKRLLEKIDNL